MDRDEMKELARMIEGQLSIGRELTEKEFDELYPDWDETIDEIAAELGRRRQKRDKLL